MDDALAQQMGPLIKRLHAGDPTARDQLIELSWKRLLTIARSMLRRFPRVKRKEETDDLLLSAMGRFLRALRAVPPANPQEFFALATRQIQWELLDLVRHYYGPHGSGAHEAKTPNWISVEIILKQSEDNAHGDRCPLTEDDWVAFHEAVAKLPTEEREVVGLVWYHGMTQVQAASVLNVSTPTIKRWWKSALLNLQGILRGT